MTDAKQNTAQAKTVEERVRQFREWYFSLYGDGMPAALNHKVHDLITAAMEQEYQRGIDAQEKYMLENIDEAFERGKREEREGIKSTVQDAVDMLWPLTAMKGGVDGSEG